MFFSIAENQTTTVISTTTPLESTTPFCVEASLLGGKIDVDFKITVNNVPLTSVQEKNLIDQDNAPVSVPVGAPVKIELIPASDNVISIKLNGLNFNSANLVPVDSTGNKLTPVRSLLKKNKKRSLCNVLPLTV